jgi:hypothetical protein
VTGTGPLGCVPAELAMRSPSGRCAAELQRATNLFNPQLVQMIGRLNSRIGRDVFIAVNTHRMHNNFIDNPQSYGIHTYIHTYIHMSFLPSLNILTFFTIKYELQKFKKKKNYPFLYFQIFYMFNFFYRICYVEGGMLWARTL